MNTLVQVFIICECVHTKFQYIGVMAQGDNGSSTMSSAQATKYAQHSFAT